jgi:hypothetical protein
MRKIKRLDSPHPVDAERELGGDTSGSEPEGWHAREEALPSSRGGAYPMLACRLALSLSGCSSPGRTAS